MKNLQLNTRKADNTGVRKRNRPFNVLHSIALLILVMLLNSCEAIGDIFKAGMGVGIFLVLAVVGIIIFFVMRAGKK